MHIVRDLDYVQAILHKRRQIIGRHHNLKFKMCFQNFSIQMLTLFAQLGVWGQATSAAHPMLIPIWSMENEYA